MRNDAKLVEAALGGGPEAFGPIVERYQDAVFGIALARLRHFHEAEDAAQQVFVEAFQRLGNLKDPARLGAWLRSVTIHRCIDRLRQRREVSAIEQGALHASDAPTPPAEVERRELRDQVLDAIAQLSKTQQETTTLFYINGYSVEEVATMQEVPVGTVKRRLHDARAKLKEVMIGMVENVLKSEAPKRDFAERVFALLSGEHRLSHQELVAELRRIGMDGFDGFIQAASSPRWQTRRTTMSMTRAGDYDTEAVARLLKKAATDSNKKVRHHVAALLLLDVSDKRKRQEFVPLVLAQLADSSARVRARAAHHLARCTPDAVPLEVAARAMLDERHPRVQWAMRHLLRAVLDAREGKTDS